MSAYDVKLTTRNAADTSFVETTITPPAAAGFIDFASQVPVYGCWGAFCHAVVPYNDGGLNLGAPSNTWACLYINNVDTSVVKTGVVDGHCTGALQIQTLACDICVNSVSNFNMYACQDSCLITESGDICTISGADIVHCADTGCILLSTRCRMDFIGCGCLSMYSAGTLALCTYASGSIDMHSDDKLTLFGTDCTRVMAQCGCLQLLSGCHAFLCSDSGTAYIVGPNVQINALTGSFFASAATGYCMTGCDISLISNGLTELKSNCCIDLCSTLSLRMESPTIQSVGCSHDLNMTGYITEISCINTCRYTCGTYQIEAMGHVCTNAGCSFTLLSAVDITLYGNSGAGSFCTCAYNSQIESVCWLTLRAPSLNLDLGVDGLCVNGIVGVSCIANPGCTLTFCSGILTGVA